MECEKCEEPFEPNEGNTEIIDSGESFDPEYGAYHWWEGFVICECGHKNDYQDQSI